MKSLFGLVVQLTLFFLVAPIPPCLSSEVCLSKDFLVNYARLGHAEFKLLNDLPNVNVNSSINGTFIFKELVFPEEE